MSCRLIFALHPSAERAAVCALVVLVGFLSIAPTMNMLSRNQVMNTAFNPLQIANTYGAFGSITRDRFEIAIEGTADETIADRSEWREYQFKGKPGSRRDNLQGCRSIPLPSSSRS